MPDTIPNFLYPHVASFAPDNSSFTINMSKLGRYKNTSWSFQDEWRYIINILPMNMNQPVENLETAATIMANRILQGVEKQKFPYYDMHLDDEAFNNMEVTLSPAISSGERVIVDALRSTYAPKMTISNSSLYGTM